MSTRKNKEGRWEVEFQYRGQRVHRVLPEGKKKSDADTLERKLRGQIFDTKDLGNVPEYSIGEEIMRYLNGYQGKAKPESHARALAPFIRGKSMRDVVEVARSVANDVSVTRSTRNRRIAILRRVAHVSYRAGRLGEPLHTKIEMLPENPPRTVYLSRNELAALLRNIRTGRYQTGRQKRIARDMARAALALAFTGLREGELLALKPEDVVQGVIRVSSAAANKGGLRSVPILPSVQFCFKRLPFEFHPTSLSHAVSRASGGKVRVHDLRHTCASLLIQAGVPLFTVGAILGHSSQQTTKRYAHLDVSTMEAAIAKLEPNRELKRQPKEKAA